MESCDFKAATKLEEVNNCGSTDTGAALQQLPAFFILRILIVIHWSWSDWKEWEREIVSNSSSKKKIPQREKNSPGGLAGFWSRGLERRSYVGRRNCFSWFGIQLKFVAGRPTATAGIYLASFSILELWWWLKTLKVSFLLQMIGSNDEQKILTKNSQRWKNWSKLFLKTSNLQEWQKNSPTCGDSDDQSEIKVISKRTLKLNRENSASLNECEKCVWVSVRMGEILSEQCAWEREMEKEREAKREGKLIVTEVKTKIFFSQKNNLISTLKLKDSSKKPFHFSSWLSFLQMWIFLWRSFVYIKLVMKKWANTD